MNKFSKQVEEYCSGTGPNIKVNYVISYTAYTLFIRKSPHRNNLTWLSWFQKDFFGAFLNCVGFNKKTLISFCL